MLVVVFAQICLSDPYAQLLISRSRVEGDEIQLHFSRDTEPRSLMTAQLENGWFCNAGIQWEDQPVDAAMTWLHSNIGNIGTHNFCFV